MNVRIFVSFKIEDAKRDMDSLTIWLGALEEEGEDCTQDFASIENIREQLDKIGERHGDRRPAQT